METIMPYLADGVLLAVFVIVVIHAARIGFARSMAGIAAWIIAAALALHFCTPLAQTVYTQFLQQRVTEKAQQEISERTDAIQVATLAQDMLEMVPQIAVQAAQSVGVDVDALKDKTQQLSPDVGNAAQQAEEKVLRPVIVAALRCVIFLIILIVSSILVQIVLQPVGKALHRLPVIGTADRALGGVLGILKGAVAVAVLSIIGKILSGVVSGSFEDVVSQSKIIPFIENSPFAGKFFQA